MPVKNRIEQFREAAGLTQRALGALLATSPEQIARHEAGAQISPDMASAIARVLGQSLSTIFPDIGERPPKSQREWKRLGFDVLAPSPTWYAHIRLRGVDEEFSYLVDSAECARLDRIFDGVDVSDFISFSSCARSIYVNAKCIQRISIFEDEAALEPGFRHSVDVLEPKFGLLRIHFRDRANAWEIPSDEDIDGVFSALEGAIDIADEFLSFYRECGTVYIRTGEIALVEVPKPELLDEMSMPSADF